MCFRMIFSLSVCLCFAQVRSVIRRGGVRQPAANQLQSSLVKHQASTRPRRIVDLAPQLVSVQPSEMLWLLKIFTNSYFPGTPATLSGSALSSRCSGHPLLLPSSPFQGLLDPPVLGSASADFGHGSVPFLVHLYCEY